MEFFNEEEQKNINNNYKPTTMKQVRYVIKKVRSLINFDQFRELVDKQSDLMNKIDGLDCKNNVKSNLVFTTIKLLKLCKCDIDQCMIDYSERINKKKINDNLDNRDKRTIQQTVSMKDIYEWIKVNHKTKDEVYMFAILADIPIRLSEFSGMTSINNGVSNFIDKNNGRLIIRDHKNKGVREIDLSEECLKELEDCEYVFKGLTPKQIQDKYRCLTDKYKKVNNIDKSVKLGIHEMRAVEEMKNMSNLKPNMSSEEIKCIIQKSKDLGHSIETALTFYTTPIKEDEKEEDEVIRILDHEGDIEKPTKLLLKYSRGKREWKDMKDFNSWKYIDLVVKYKRYISD